MHRKQRFIFWYSLRQDACSNKKKKKELRKEDVLKRSEEMKHKKLQQ